MMNFLRTFVRDDAGASAAEYALIVAVIGTGIAVAAVTMGSDISSAMTTAGTCITSKGATC